MDLQKNQTSAFKSEQKSQQQEKQKMDQRKEKGVYLGPFWYDGKAVQWIFCNLIPFAFLVAYPLIIISYYTILHIIMALIFLQITIYTFYINSPQDDTILNNKDNQLRELFIEKKVVKLRNVKKWFLMSVLITEGLNILSKIIFVIIYYTKKDLDIESIKSILQDLEFFFVSGVAKESGVQEAKMILLSFVPNLLLFSVFALAKKICKYEHQVIIEDFLVPSHQGLLNFLVLVSLVACQVFNPSITAFGFLGFFLISQINSLQVKNTKIASRSSLRIQFLIQLYCFVQFFMIMFTSTYTFEEKQYFDIQFLGCGSIANFQQDWKKNPFYVLCLSLLFLISVIYSQTLNFQRQREISLKIFKQIEKEKKRSRMKRALIKFLTLTKFKERQQEETQSDKLPQSAVNKDIREHTNSVQESYDGQIEMASFNNVPTEQRIIDDRQNSQEAPNSDQKSFQIFKSPFFQEREKTKQDINVADQQGRDLKEENCNIPPETKETKNKNRLNLYKRSSSPYVKGEIKSTVGSEQHLNLQDNHDDSDINKNYMIINNIRRRKQKTNTFTVPSTLSRNDEGRRGNNKAMTIIHDQYMKKITQEKDNKQDIVNIKKQLDLLETDQDAYFKANPWIRHDELKSEEPNQGNKEDLPNIRERSNKTLSFYDKYAVLKQKMMNCVLELSQRFFIYIKQQFEDSIIPIRFLQCCSIVAIMRYPCYYSLGLIAWVLLSSIFKFEIKIKFLLIVIIPIPCLIVIYSFNLYGSIENSHFLQPKHGFVFQQYFWIECIILNTLIFLFFTYLLIIRRLTLNMSSINKSQEAAVENQNNKNDKLKRNASEIPVSVHNSVIQYVNHNQDGSNNSQKQEIQMTSSVRLANQQNGSTPNKRKNDITPNKKSDEASPNPNNDLVQPNLNRVASKSDPIRDQIHARLSNNNSNSRLKKESFNYQEYFENQQQRFSNYSDSQSFKDDNQQHNQKLPISQKPIPLITIFFAFILKYSQTLALFLLYWIGFYTFNIVHLLLVLFFLIFFQNSMRTINVKKNGKIYEMSFSFKYWYLLLIYLALVIIAKFVYTILEQGMDNYGDEITLDDDAKESSSTSIFKFLGINYNYEMPFSLSLAKKDYAGLSIIWIAYMFATLQEDTYRSETYQKYSNKINFLIQDIPLVKKYSPNFLSYVNKLTILTKNLLFWLSFFVITTCLILQEFSFINSILLLSSFCLIFYYIFKYKDPQAFHYEKYYKVWDIFNQVVIGYILLCYVLQFTALKFSQDYIFNPNSEVYKIFNRNRGIYGFYFELSGNESLRFKFFPIILVLYFAIYVQNYLKMISNAVRYHIEDEQREKAASNNSSESSVSRRSKQNDLVGISNKEDQVITIDIINKNYQKMRRDENRQIYNHYVLFDLFNEVSGIESILRALQFIIIDIQNFLVFLFAMIFRLSISMLLFIIIYLKFYYRYHHQLESFLENKYMKKSIHYFFKSFQKFFSFPQKNLGWKIKDEQKMIDEQINNRDYNRRKGVVSAKYLNDLIKDKKQQEYLNIQNQKEENLKQNKQENQENLQQNQTIQTDSLKKKRLSKRNILEVGIDDKIKEFVQIQEKLKIDEQLAIWGYSFWFSFFCISVTYGSQFLASDMAYSNIGSSMITSMQWFLFIFGTSCNTLSLSSIFRNIYFYLIMFWVNVTIFILIRMKYQHEASLLQAASKQAQEQNLNKDKENGDDKQEQIRNHVPSTFAIKNQKNTVDNNQNIAIKSSPIKLFQTRDSSDSFSQFNRLSYLHLNPSGVSPEKSNELNERRIIFEQKRIARAQEGEGDVEITYKDEGGLLPYKIKWCKIIKNYCNLSLLDSDNEEENETIDNFNKDDDDDDADINSKSEIIQDQVIQNIYKKYKNDTIDVIKESKNDEDNQQNFSSSIEGGIEDEGGINQNAMRLGDNSQMNTKNMTLLNDQFEQGKASQSKNDVLLNKSNQKGEKAESKARREEERRQREILHNDSDFIYNNYLRIQYFYEMKSVYVQEKCKSALLLALYPFYSVILMHVSEQKHDIFSYIYLFVAFLGNSIKGINRNTIFLVLIQYMLLLLNINQDTSPLSIDQHLLDYKKMSLIQRYITDEEILQYLAFSSSQSNSATISFILNSTVFFIIGFYFHCYKYIVTSIAFNINSIKNRVKYIYENNLFPSQIAPIQQSNQTLQDDPNPILSRLSINSTNQEKKVTQHLDKSHAFSSSNPNISNYSIEGTNKQELNQENGELEDEIINPTPPVWINYQNWRSASFIKVNLVYEMSISFGYILSAVLIMIISCQYLDIFNFIILAYTLIVFFITEFIVPFPRMLNQKRKIINILRVLEFYLYGVFALYSTMQIPYVRKNISSIGWFLSNQCLELIIIDKIYIMFCVLCTKMLLTSSDFKTITFSVSQSYILSANLSHKAISMNQNDEIISELLQNEKERRSLREVVQKVTQTLKNWHKAQYSISSNLQVGDKSIVPNLNASGNQMNNNQSQRSSPRLPNGRLTATQSVVPSAFCQQKENQQFNSNEESFSDPRIQDNNITFDGHNNKTQSKKDSTYSMESPNFNKLSPQHPKLKKSHKYSYDSNTSQGNDSPKEKHPTKHSLNIRNNNLQKNSKILLEQVEMNNDVIENQNEINAAKQQAQNDLLPNVEKKNETGEDLDYSSNELISNADETQKNIDIYMNQGNPKFLGGPLQINLNNSMNDLSLSKIESNNRNPYKQMKINKVSSIDHLEQTFQFDPNQSPLKKSMNASKTDLQPDLNLRQKKKERSKVNFKKETKQNEQKKNKELNDKEEKANRFHNTEKMEAQKDKDNKGEDDIEAEFDEDEGFYSSEEIDDENNDLMEQIKQEFDKKIKKQQEEEETLKNNAGKQFKREKSHKFLIKLCKAVESQINSFLFMDSIQIADYILSNNCQIFSKIYVNIDDLLLNNFTSIMEYSHILSIVYYCLYQTIQEAGIEFAFNNLFTIIQRATECDITTKMIYNQLIETSSLYPTIPYYYHLRKQQEIDIEDKRILQREQRNNLNHICIYHSQVPIYVYNVKSTNSLPFSLYTKIGLISRILKSSMKLALSNWHFICFLFFLTYYLSNSGVMSLPFPALVFLNFLIEKRFISLKIWMISFAYVSVLLFFKFLIQIKGLEIDLQLQQTFFNDSLSFSYEGYLIFLIFVAQILSKYIGLDKEDLYNSENIHQSYVRKCVNDLEFRQDFIDNCSKQNNQILQNVQSNDNLSPTIKKINSKQHSRMLSFKNSNSIQFDNQTKHDITEDKQNILEDLNSPEIDAIKDQNIMVFGKSMRGRSDDLYDDPMTHPNLNQNEAIKQYNMSDDDTLLKKTLKKQNSMKLKQKDSWKQNYPPYLEDLSLIGEGNNISHNNKESVAYSQVSQQARDGNAQNSHHSTRLMQLSVYEKNQSEKEKSFSMHEQMLRDLRIKPTLLVNQSFKKENFFLRVFNTYNKRPGRDLYPWIALVQVILLLFIFIFYTRIDANNTQGINDQLKYNQFSGEMVICLFIQVAFMVVERYLALRRVPEKTEAKKSKKKKKKKTTHSSLSPQDSEEGLNSDDSLLNSQKSEDDESLEINLNVKNSYRKYPQLQQHQQQLQQQQYQQQSQLQQQFDQEVNEKQRDIKRKATYKKDKENLTNLRSSTRIQQEYESYRNFQEMQSLMLNEEDEDEIDLQKNPNQNKQIPHSQQYNQKLPQFESKEQTTSPIPKEQPFNLKLNRDAPSPVVLKNKNYNPHTPTNYQNKLSIDQDLQIKQLRKLSTVLCDDVLFANLEKEQINANLQIYKQFNNANSKKDKQVMNSSSDEDESLISNFSAISQCNLPQNQNESQQAQADNNLKGEEKKTEQLQIRQKSDIENQVRGDSQVFGGQQQSEEQQKKDILNTLPTQNATKQQIEQTQMTKAFPKDMHTDQSFDLFSSLIGQNAQNSLENLDFSPKAQKKIEVKKKENKSDNFVLTTELLKYIQMIIFTTLLSWFVFFYIPQSFKTNNLDDGAMVVSYKTNGFLTAFVFINSIYMLLSTLQLRYGYKKLKLRNTILQSKHSLAGLSANIMRAIPFLQELKVMLDWTVTKTSLTLFQWFLLEDIHYSLYVAKLDSKDARSTRVDQPQSKVIKFLLGFLSVLIILLLLFGPMLLFSTLNPISDYNGIISGQIELGLEFSQKNQINYYPLFQNTHINNLSVVNRDCSYNPNQIQQPADNTSTQEICYWDLYKFKNVNLIYTSDSQQFQKFNLYSYSEKQWDVSQPSKSDIKNKFNEILTNPISQLKVRLVIKLLMNREVSQYNSNPYISYYPNKYAVNTNSSQDQMYLSKNIVQALLDTIQDCSKPAVKLTNFYVFIFSSTTEKQSYVSETIIQRDKDKNIQYIQDAYINLQCYEEPDQKETYWNLSIDPEMKQGLTFFTLSDKYSNATFGFSIITLYTSVILVIGKFIRDAFRGELEKIIIKCMPNPDELLRLCEAISNARNERDLLRERILYFELMDLIRSPEILKKLTGSYSFVLNQKHKLELQYDIKEKQFKLNKEKLLKKQKAKKKLEEKAKKNKSQQKAQRDQQYENQEIPQGQYQNNIFVDNNYPQIEEQIEEEDQEEKTQIKRMKKSN